MLKLSNKGALLGQVVVVWPGDGLLGHIYHWALGNTQFWQPDYPEMTRPICGAKPFRRKAHCDLIRPASDYGAVCTSCVVSLALNYPHLFEKGGP